MSSAVDLDHDQYVALHDGRRVEGLDYLPKNEFVIDRVGRSDERHFSDLGIEYYRYVS
jgi:hydroxymethylglutaryl-CoA synthase